MLKPNKNFLVGQKFGRLTVVKRLPNKVPFGWYEAPDDMPSLVPYSYECACSCGAKGVVVKEYDLVKGRKKSCGCWRKAVQKEYWDQKTYWKRRRERVIQERQQILQRYQQLKKAKDQP